VVQLWEYAADSIIRKQRESRVNNKLVGYASLFVILAAGQTWGAEPAGISDCADVKDVESKSRPYWKGETMMTNLLILQGKGEAKFHLSLVPPASECVFGKFDVAGVKVEGIRSPLEKSPETTRLWRFRTDGAEPREVLVVCDGTVSVTADKEVFFVAEERKGSISYYAMFRDQPTFAALKPLVTSIIDGSAAPLATVRWPAGAVEPLIDAYDMKRLK
jgi:hypothetical protein